MLGSTNVPKRLNLALVLVVILVGAGLAYAYTINKKASETSNVVEIPDRPLYMPEVKEESLSDTPVVVQGTYVLKIDKIKVHAPVVPNVDGLDEKGYLKALEKGVAHYKGTPLPGNKGNAFIFGHSSYYANKPGDYKEVLKELGTLKKGDTFSVVMNDTNTYNYSITQSKLTSEDDTQWLDESKDEIVTVMTCWPPGTYAKRWVVQGKRI